MEEYQQYVSLVNAVVGGESPGNNRREAEIQLTSIHHSSDMWQHLLQFLAIAVESDDSCSDNVLFFLGMYSILCSCSVYFAIECLCIDVFFCSYY